MYAQTIVLSLVVLMALLIIPVAHACGQSFSTPSDLVHLGQRNSASTSASSPLVELTYLPFPTLQQ